MDETARMSDAACVVREPDARVRDRDDACPGMLDAATGDDGLIARIRLPGGRITAPQLRALAAGAADLGKGFVDLTVRANAQVRGLSDAGVRALAGRLADAGLLPSPTHDRVRNIIASPFAGRDPGALVDGEHLVAALDAALCDTPELAALPGRFQYAVDDGGLRVATLRHDVALVAVARGVVEVRLAGTATGLYASDADAAVGLALAAGRAFLRERMASGAWHVRELPGGAEQLAAALAADLDTDRLAPDSGVRERGADLSREGGRALSGHAVDGPRRAGPVIGVVPQADGRFAVSALVPLGRLTHDQLTVLADLVDARGDGAAGGSGVQPPATPLNSVPPHTSSPVAATREPAGRELRLRIAPWRGVVVGDVPSARVAEVVTAMDAAGLPTDPASPWRRVSACSGLGECRRAAVDVRALAREFAVNPDAPGGAVHFAACERACGRPAGSAVVIPPVPPADTSPRTSSPSNERQPWTTG